MTITELVKKAYANAKEKGWHDIERTPLEYHMLIVSEIAEATEAVRCGTMPSYFIGKKPEGELVELADAVIRIADYFGSRGWDLEKIIKWKMAYNKTRSHMHGGKKI